MAERRRVDRRISGAREAIAVASTLGGVVKAERVRKRWTQARLAGLVGIEQSRQSEIERGLGAGAPLDLWIALGIALDRPLAIAFTQVRDPEARLADAGHLEIQEAVLWMTTRRGGHGSFELRTRASETSRSIDVLVRDDTVRRLLVLECWNRFGDLGAASRSTDRKVIEAADIAVAIGGDRPYTVHSCWIVRPTAANRELIRRYPQVFRARFRGSSVMWAKALNDGAQAPNEPSLVWLDVAARRAVQVRMSG